MWRYIKGVENPKRKQTPEEGKLKDQEYEKKGKWLFLDEWKEGRLGFNLTVNSKQYFVITALIKELIQRNHPL